MNNGGVVSAIWESITGVVLYVTLGLGQMLIRESRGWDQESTGMLTIGSKASTFTATVLCAGPHCGEVVCL